MDSEKEINENLHKNFDFVGKLEIYGLIDHSWYQKYKQYLFCLLSGKTNNLFAYDFYSLNAKSEKKIFCLPDNYHSFNFRSNFDVTKKFINLLS